MNTLEFYIQKSKTQKYKINNIIKRSDGAGLTDMNISPELYSKLYAIQQHCFPRELINNFELLECSLLLDSIMTPLQKKQDPSDIFENSLSGSIKYNDRDKSYEYLDTFLFEEMRVQMEKKKCLFIMFSFEDYDTDIVDKQIESIAHSTCAILLPKKKHYVCFYVNPHGRDTKETKYFKIPISKKRERIYKYKEPLDVVFMKAFCNSFNNHETTKRKIHYNETARYNYYGVNLQSGDGYGMCYIFPFIIYYFVGKYLTRGRYIKNKNNTFVYIDSGIHLLAKGRLGYFIESFFAEFKSNYKNLFTNENVTYRTKRNQAERFVITNAGHFLKAISSPTVSFMLQSKINNIVTY
jgi:hypothetical protein